MVLLNDVVEVLDLAQAREAPQLTIALHGRDRGGVGRVLVHRDRAWVPRVRLAQRFAEEPLRRRGIPLGREQKVDRLAPAVDGTVQIGPAPLHRDVCLINPPRAVAPVQVRPDPLLQLWRISLDPAEDGCVVHRDATVLEHQREIAVADREHQIPSDRPQDHLGRELPALELLAVRHATRAAIRLVETARLSNPDPPHKFATEPRLASRSVQHLWTPPSGQGETSGLSWRVVGCCHLSGLWCGSEPPRACMGVRGPGPKSQPRTRGTVLHTGYPDPVSPTVAPCRPSARPTPSRRRRAYAAGAGAR